MICAPQGTRSPSPGSGRCHRIPVANAVRIHAIFGGIGAFAVKFRWSSGTTVTSAGLVLAGTFAVFALVGGRGSGGSQIRDVGVGLALGVLMDTFIVRTVLVPCTVILLGRWNWWPSAPHPAGRAAGRP